MPNRICRLVFTFLVLVLSAALASFAAEPGRPPRVLFLIGEPEYQTRDTLAEFARTELEPQGVACSFALEDPGDPSSFTGLEALKGADLLFISVRRHAPKKEQLAAIRDYIAAGGAVAGIRTASHAFGAKPKDDRHEGWEGFDAEVLGGSYAMHYGDTQAVVRVVAGSVGHPVLKNLGVTEFSTFRLYRNPRLAATATPLLTGHVKGLDEIQNVAWVNTNGNRRVFYTSLGAPQDFRTEPFRRLLRNGVFWALGRPAPESAVSLPKKKEKPTGGAGADLSGRGALSPAEGAKALHTAGELEIEQVLAEPVIEKPVFLNFDERGRMWVVEYRQYPEPAGLKLISHDSYWRAVYDKVPPPPPNHIRGLDRITIHESTKHDGVFDKHTTFVEGLNIATAVERGRGGVWVLNPPYLLFYPDANNDDVPDGDPVVHLQGFGLEDTHSVANSLRWGPDGWLYGAQGSTVTSQIIRPGIDKTPLVKTMGQLIWRYQPETKRFEVFSEGGGNAFGVEMDAKGRIFSGHNGGDTRGFHYMQGAYLQKGFEKHGPLSNPYAFGYFPPMKHTAVERFTHNFIIYEGGALPEEFNGKLFGAEPLQGRVVESDFIPDQSTFRTVDLGYPVTSDDHWFRPVDIKAGPDGAIYLCDWYDRQVTHLWNYQGLIDKTHGRVYRLKAKGAKAGGAFDGGKLSSETLVGLLASPNKWIRQTAQRLLADRKDPAIIPALNRILDEKTGQIAMEALWALHGSGGFNEAAALWNLDHPDPFVRLWAARLAGDENSVTPKVAKKMVEMARSETSLEARDQLASTARRLPAEAGLPIVRALLLHDGDAGDNRLPLLLWWAIEAKVESDQERVLELFEDPGLWSHPIVRKDILDRITRRLALSGSRRDLFACAKLFELSPDKESSRILTTGFEAAFQGRTLTGLPEDLLKAMARFDTDSVALRLRQGDAAAVSEALKVIADSKARKSARLEYIGILGEVKAPAAEAVLLQIPRASKDDAVTKAALQALQAYDDPRIGDEVVSVYDKLNPATRTAAQALLASRAGWARAWLRAMREGKTTREAAPPGALSAWQGRGDEELTKLMSELWGKRGKPTTAQMQEQIQRLAGVVNSGSGDPYNGRTLFQSHCAVCHTLFGLGAQVGPDLTSYKRDDLRTMLVNIVNPSAEIREGYENHLVETKDDRSLSGFLVEQNNQVVVLRGLDGQNTTLSRKEITRMETSGLSVMPEGLLDTLKEPEIRDLFAYLRSSQPLVGSPPEK